jgi:exo-1,4-beta-D-glucosaminidase
MLNNGWPSVHWNLYDYFFKPGGGYFGTKKALEPIHILLDYNANAVKVFNSTLVNASNLTATVRIYNIPDLTPKYTNHVVTNCLANATTPLFSIPSVSVLTTTYFIRLQLTDASGASVSDNLYWYSTSPDTLGRKSTWYNTAIGPPTLPSSSAQKSPPAKVAWRCCQFSTAITTFRFGLERQPQ